MVSMWKRWLTGSVSRAAMFPMPATASALVRFGAGNCALSLAGMPRACRAADYGSARSGPGKATTAAASRVGQCVRPAGARRPKRTSRRAVLRHGIGDGGTTLRREGRPREWSSTGCRRTARARFCDRCARSAPGVDARPASVTAAGEPVELDGGLVEPDAFAVADASGVIFLPQIASKKCWPSRPKLRAGEEQKLQAIRDGADPRVVFAPAIEGM